MAKVKITGHASGSGVITVTAPNTSTDRTITLPDATATIATTTDVAARLPSIVDGGNATAITIASNETVTLNAVGGNSYSDAASKVLKTAGTQHTILSVETSSTGGHNAALELESNGNPVVIGTSGDDKMFFQTNAATGMVIDNTGAVTMPLQPAFLVFHNATTSNIANGNTISFNEEKFDQNSDFNISNEIFTAPVTGKYQFSFLVSVTDLDASATYNRILLKSSNRTVPFGITHANMFSGDPGYYSFEGSMLLDMDANDTCFLEWNQAGGTAQADVFDSTYFSGYLAC